MRRFALVAAIAAMPLVLFAQAKIATVDMETVIKAHPQTESNTKRLQEKQKSSMAERDKAGEKLDSMKKELSDLSEKASNSALNDKAREAAKTRARELLKQMRIEEDSYEAQVKQLQKGLTELELTLFEATMRDVNDKITEIAKKNHFDMVVDISAYRPGAPIPIVLWSDPALDITEEVVKKTGGTMPSKEGK